MGDARIEVRLVTSVYTFALYDEETAHALQQLYPQRKPNDGVPVYIRPIFFDVKLIALKKPEDVVAILSPKQVGVGVAVGAEAMVHACRSQVLTMTSGTALLKLDFTNAFNNICHSAVLLEAMRDIPVIYRFIAPYYDNISRRSTGFFFILLDSG
ncbi:hypothetical protein GJ496_009875 [Pomphorhynchus laevis]|nr:hypothetical protein GJ496_009875 [Pomphorhynchus laevis]